MPDDQDFKMPKKVHSIKNLNVNKVNQLIEDLEFLEDFGMMSLENQNEIIEKKKDYFEALNELRIKLQLFPPL